MTDTTTGWAGPQQNRWVTLFKLGGVVVSSLLLLRLTVDIVMAFFNGAPWWPLVPAALLACCSLPPGRDACPSARHPTAVLVPLGWLHLVARLCVRAGEWCTLNVAPG